MGDETSKVTNSILTPSKLSDVVQSGKRSLSETSPEVPLAFNARKQKVGDLDVSQLIEIIKGSNLTIVKKLDTS